MQLGVCDSPFPRDERTQVPLSQFTSGQPCCHNASIPELKPPHPALPSALVDAAGVRVQIELAGIIQPQKVAVKLHCDWLVSDTVAATLGFTFSFINNLTSTTNRLYRPNSPSHFLSSGSRICSRCPSCTCLMPPLWPSRCPASPECSTQYALRQFSRLLD